MMEITTNTAFLIGAATILCAEIIAGRHWRAYDLNELKVTALCVGVSTAIARPLAALLVAGAVPFVLPQYHNVLTNVPFWPAAIAILLVSDFCFYWVHRMAHKSRTGKMSWLWNFHRTHHSAKSMNILLNFRVLPAWLFIVPNTWIWALTIYLGMGPETAAVIVVTKIWNLITHSNFRWDDTIRQRPVVGKMWRALEHVIVTPGIHHTHHGYGKDGASYRNFSVVISFYDYLFGTLHIPEGRPAKYGLPGPNDVHWSKEVLYPFVRK